MKKIIGIICLVLTMVFFNGAVCSVHPQPVSAASQTPEDVQQPEQVGNMEGYDCSHDQEIIDAIRNGRGSVDVTGFGITKENFNSVYGYIVKMFPGMCSSPQLGWSRDGNDVTEIRFTYAQDHQALLARYRELDRIKEQILSRLDPQMTDVEKALVLHDYIISHCAYDYGNYLKKEEGVIKKLPADDGTAYGVLALGTGVCQGYAMAYAYLMQECGIPCLIVTSEMAGHVWNLACLDGKWCHIDTTWDDPVWDQLGNVSHKWFAVSTETMLSYDERKADYIVTDTGGKSGIQAWDKTYETGFWQHTDAGVHYYKSHWYYVDKESFEVCEYDPASGVKKRIGNKDGDRWKVWDKKAVYITSLAKTAASDKDFYYTTPDAVWHIDLESGDQERVFQADTREGYIYGLGTIASDLYYVLSRNPGAEGPQTYLPLNRNLAHINEAHAWTEADRIPAICTRDGAVIYQCTKNGCTAVRKESGQKDKEAHDYVEELKQASFYNSGFLTKRCRNCKKILSVEKIYPLKTMALSSKSYDFNNKINKPGIIITDTRGRKISSSSYQVSYSDEESRYPGRYTVHAQLTGLYTGGFTGEYKILPPKMKIKKAVAKKGGFSISWEPYPEELADGYSICYISADSGEEIIKQVSGTSSSHVTVKGLKKGTVYGVYLLAYKDTGEGNEPVYSIWSEGVFVQVL